jgi:hypothetical protein
MPTCEPSRGQPAGPLQLSFVERLHAGRVAPVISDEAVFGLVPGSRDRPTWDTTDDIRHPRQGLPGAP